jgi:hypothetical protein
MKSGDSSPSAARIAAALDLIDREVARLNGDLLVNEFVAVVPAHVVPIVPTINTAEEPSTDSRALLPPNNLDLGRCKVVSQAARGRPAARPRSTRKGASA